jgi:CRISPR/Cas system-associated exonuclease Cas4 (RecB family)
MPIDFNRTEASAAPASIAINAVLDAGARADEEQTRGYLGASAVGHPCLRKVQFDWMCDPVHPVRIRDIFARGHFFEQQTREHFERAGFRFAEKDRLEFETLDGWLRGHADGIFLSGPDIPGVTYPALWEHKAINTKGWRSLERDGLVKSYPQYAAQVALYQLYLGVEKAPAIFTATNADDCARMHILVPFDDELVETTIQRVRRVVDATRAGELLPRMTDDSNNWRCRQCGHRERCWRQ